MTAMLPADAIHYTARLIGAALVISSAEYLATIELYADDNLLSWRVLGDRSKCVDRWMAPICSGRGLAAFLVARAAAGAGLVLATGDAWVATFAALALVLSVTLSYRNSAGGDGSDQMTIIVLSGLVLSLLAFNRSAGYWFIAGQAALSYFSAGIAKLVSPVWRDGSALFLIFRTATYGQSRLGQFLGRHTQLARALCWGTIVFEVGFPASLFAPPGVLYGVLLTGIVFHLANAALMGLNVFTFAFVATYPSILLCSHK